jgi:hypothetical protein
MRRAFAAAALALCLSAGCSDDEPGPTPTTSSSSSDGMTASGSPPTATITTPTPPELPDAARAKTTAGAKAFVKYYVDVLNYGYRYQDESALRKISATACKICQSFRRNIHHLKQSGGRQIGGSWRVLALDKVASDETGKEILLATIHVARGKARLNKDDPYKPIHSSTSFYEFHVTWSTGLWLTVELRTA